MLEKAKKFYRSSYLNRMFPRPIGCSLEQIQKLESAMGLEFPLALKEYLDWLGNDTHGCLEGSDAFAKDIIENTEYIPELLEENGIAYKLDHPIVCFYMHQGYQAAWFEVTGEQDPTVLYFDEGEYAESDGVKAIQIKGTFSQFLAEFMEALEAWAKSAR